MRISDWSSDVCSSDLPGMQSDIDLRVGGGFTIAFRTQDGELHSVSGTYREIVPGEKLVFSWAWISTPERQSQVTISLKPDGAGTLLTLHHEQFFADAARDGHRRGWTRSEEHTSELQSLLRTSYAVS